MNKLTWSAVIVIMVSLIVVLVLAYPYLPSSKVPAPTVTPTQTPSPTPTPEPTETTEVYRIGLSIAYEVNTTSGTRIVFTCDSNSTSNITFSSDNITYNGLASSNYTNFAPQLYKGFIGMNEVDTPIQTYTIPPNGTQGDFEIYFPQGQGTGSPWGTFMNISIKITTYNAQGSIAVILNENFGIYE